MRRFKLEFDQLGPFEYLRRRGGNEIGGIGHGCRIEFIPAPNQFKRAMLSFVGHLFIFLIKRRGAGGSRGPPPQPGGFHRGVSLSLFYVFLRKYICVNHE